jgi:putative ABC transport system substrate-binding protein
MTHMKRREFVMLLGVAALTWSALAFAQQRAVPVIGFLNSATADGYADMVAAFRQGLAETGYVEGRNVATAYRWADGQIDRLPALAAELVRLPVAAIAANGPAAIAAKAATTTIPIVFSVGFDPVEVGLVASLNRPGGNLTGSTVLNVELGPKRLELLHQLIPAATTIATLVNPAGPDAEPFVRGLQAGARALGLQLHILRASTAGEIETAFATLVQLRVGGLVIGNDPFFNTRSEQLAVLAVRHAIPTIYQFRQFAAAGGLMSYGGRITDTYHLVGSYTGRILKGEKPADLPVQQAMRIELIINLKIAQALGITIPAHLLVLADEVIQ